MYAKAQNNAILPQNCGDKDIVNKLMGEWQWVCTISGGDNTANVSYSNPAQCHCSKSYIFSNNCTFKYIYNDTVYERNFFVKYDSLIYNSYMLCSYNPNSSDFNNVNNSYKQFLVVSGDTLILKQGISVSGSFCSCEYYIKK
jgi:hypothetical protein